MNESKEHLNALWDAGLAKALPSHAESLRQRKEEQELHQLFEEMDWQPKRSVWVRLKSFFSRR